MPRSKEKVNFTKVLLDGFTCKPTGANAARAYLADAKVPGLLFCVTPAGARSFYVYRWAGGRPRRVHLGGYPDLTIDQARAAASTAISKLLNGVDPTAEKRAVREAMTLGQLFIHYRDTHLKPHTKRWRENAHVFERVFGQAEGPEEGTVPLPPTHPRQPAPYRNWRNQPVNKMTHVDFQAIHAKLGVASKATANKVMQILSAMFNHGKLTNPIDHVKLFKMKARERYLLPEELPRFFQSLADDSSTLTRDFILMCIFTGARKTNVCEMKWADVDLDRGTWKIAETKNGDSQTVTLSPQALAVLRGRRASTNVSPWVFPSWGTTGHIRTPNESFKRILERAKIENLTIHDLRRTLGSYQAALGSSLIVIGKSLGHRSTRSTQVYARISLDPVRESVNAATAAMGKLIPNKLLAAPTWEDLQPTLSQQQSDAKLLEGTVVSASSQPTGSTAAA